MCLIEEEFEDTKGVIGIRKSKKDRQHNGPTKKDERTNNDLQITTQQTFVQLLSDMSLSII